MENKGFIWVFVILIGFLFFVEGASAAVYNATAGLDEVYECGTISEAGTYVLNQSINATGISGACLTIGVDNIVLDGAGFNLTGNDTANTRGVYAQARSNIIIKNFNNIRDFTVGIYFIGVNESLIENLTSSSNTDGVLIQTGYYNNISLVNTTLNTYSIRIGAFTTSQANYTTITNIISNSDSNGITIAAGYYNVISDVTAINGGGVGVKIYIGSYNNLSAINASYNHYGVEFDCAESNSLTDSIANYNSDTGIIFGGAGNYDDCTLTAYFNYTIRNITSNNNTQGGVYVVSVNSSNFTNIMAVNNGNYGAHFFESYENIIRDANFTGGINDTILEIANVTFVNVTYNLSNSYIYPTASYFQKWWLDATSNVASTAINWTDNLNNTDFSTSPARFELTEYYYNGSGYTYYSDYTVSASKTGYTASVNQVFNMSDNNVASFIMTAIPGADSPGGSSGSSGSTSASFWTSTYLVSDVQFRNGYFGQIGAKGRLKVNIKNEAHYVGVISLNSTGVLVNVSSVSIQEFFYIGDEKEFDADGNGLKDILVRLDNIVDNKAFIFVKVLEEVGVADSDNNVSDDTGSLGDYESAVASSFFSYFLYSVILLVILGIVLFLYLLRKRRRSKLGTEMEKVAEFVEKSEKDIGIKKV